MDLARLPRRGALCLGLGVLALPVALHAREEKGSATGQEKPVGAVEDLMREHGILRRILLGEPIAAQACLR